MSNSKPMKSMDFLEAEKQLAKIMRNVCEGDYSIKVDGLGQDEVVILSLKEYQKLVKDLSELT